MPRHVASIVRVVTYDGEAGLGGRARQLFKGSLDWKAYHLMGVLHGVAGYRGTCSKDLEESSQVQGDFVPEHFVVSTFPQFLTGGDGGIVDLNPCSSQMFGATEEGVRESGIAPVYVSDGDGVLFS